MFHFDDDDNYTLPDSPSAFTATHAERMSDYRRSDVSRQAYLDRIERPSYAQVNAGLRKLAEELK
jgi:hypothetical protein